MALIINQLNLKGYITKYSCEGHPNLGYIMFETTDILKFIDYLPDTWCVDWECYKKWGIVVLRAEFAGDVMSDEYKHEVICDLKDFVQMLPYNKKFY